MRHDAYGKTDVGKEREHNEDSILVDRDLHVYIVSDGVGGQSAGEVASQMACEVTCRELLQRRDVLAAYSAKSSAKNRDAAIDAIEQAIDTAGREIFQTGMADKAKRGMAATIAMLAVLGDNAIIAHVGDSRIYLARRGQVHLITEDHSILTERVRLGVLTQDQADSGRWKSAITRAMGLHESVQVDTLNFELLPGDDFLLCSDGLSDYMHQGAEFLEACRRNPDDVTGELVDFANRSGGKDNISAVVVRIEGSAATDTFDAFKKMETLKRLSLFAHLNFKELMCVLNIVNVRDCAAGTNLIKEGDVGNELFVAVSGTYEVSKRGRHLATLPSGSFFGEMALIGRSKRSADITCKEAGRLLVITRDLFYQLLLQKPVLATKLLWAFCQVLSDRVRASEERDG